MAWVSEAILRHLGAAAPDDVFDASELARSTALEQRQVDAAVQRLHRHGLIERCADGGFVLTEAGSEALAAGRGYHSGPRRAHGQVRVLRDTLRVRAWRALRIRRKVSLPELVTLVAQGGERDIESNLGKYLVALERAGYLKRLPRKSPGTALQSPGHTRWWLLPERDSGPLAPVWRVAHGSVYDPNSGEQWPVASPPSEKAP